MTSRRNILVIGGSALVHAALLGPLLLAPAPLSTSPELGAVSVSLIDGKALRTQKVQLAVPPRASSATQTATKADTPSEVEPQYVNVKLSESEAIERDPLNDPVALSVAAASSAAAGQPCQLSEWLRLALQADPQVQAAVLSIPRPSRSVGNAIMVWDKDWVEAPPQASAGFLVIRSALVAGLRAAPPACRAEVIRGPELMPLLSDSDATIVAVGSGEWRWDDLLRPAVLQTALATRKGH